MLCAGLCVWRPRVCTSELGTWAPQLTAVASVHAAGGKMICPPREAPNRLHGCTSIESSSFTSRDACKAHTRVSMMGSTRGTSGRIQRSLQPLFCHKAATQYAHRNTAQPVQRTCRQPRSSHLPSDAHPAQQSAAMHAVARLPRSSAAPPPDPMHPAASIPPLLPVEQPACLLCSTCRQPFFTRLPALRGPFAAALRFAPRTAAVDLQHAGECHTSNEKELLPQPCQAII